MKTDATPTGASAAQPPVIERVSTSLLDVPLGSARGGSGATRLQVLYVAITDADGATGTGFTYTLGPGAAAIGKVIEDLVSPQVLGASDLSWDRLHFELRQQVHRLGRGVTYPAISAMDIAMWDIVGKRAQLPVHALIGTHHSTVPIYGSGRSTHQMSTVELVQGANAYRDEGYAAVKLRAGVHGASRDVQRVAAVREEMGPDLEAHGRLQRTTHRGRGPAPRLGTARPRRVLA